MNRTESPQPKKRGRPPTGRRYPHVGFRSPPEVTAAIDVAAADAKRASRSEMILAIITSWLTERGYLGKAVQSLQPDQLNAENDG